MTLIETKKAARHRNRTGIALAVLLVALCPPVLALKISDVTAEPKVADPTRDQHVNIRFNLNEASEDVRVLFYDDKQYKVAVEQLGRLEPGEHQLQWSATTDSGQVLPPEAYYYVIEATDSSGQVVTYDLSDETGSEDIAAKAIRWDAKAGKVRYHLARAARVNIRIGLANNGPLLKTLIDWVPRAAGEQEEPWDGRDQSAVINLTDHAHLSVVVDAYSLPQNTLIVLPKASAPEYVPPSSDEGTPRHSAKTQPRKMHFHAQQAAETRGDFVIEFTVLGDFPKNHAGIPIVSGDVRFRLDVGEGHIQRALARRFEPVFYIDGEFMLENEMGYIPMTYTWNSRTANPGEHFITANLRGYEGNFGMATARVIVQKPTDPQKNIKQQPGDTIDTHK